MYIKEIRITNFRNFYNFSMKFHDGLNVIIGSNNSGKTGLLKAINLLSQPNNISVEDFNKNDLLSRYNLEYKDRPPEIVIEYYIQHYVSENDTTDEGVIKLQPFIEMNDSSFYKDSNGLMKFNIAARIKATYALDPKYLNDYLESVSKLSTFKEFYSNLVIYQRYYRWNYTNGSSETLIESKKASSIFKIDFIEAERNHRIVYDKIKTEIEHFLKNEPKAMINLQNVQKYLSDEMKKVIKLLLDRINKSIECNRDDIGLAKGNITISQDLRPSVDISGSYVIDVEDTKFNYVIPISYNGLGYNNLINMYMLINLMEIQKVKYLRILCLEEPEAHLHPAMQYKLFKFLRELNENKKLNQQIFVTTHSPNITAVSGLDNMYMLSYDRETELPNCVQQSLKKQFEGYEESRKHIIKFLDVTRSDMLFANKIILVEGIAEKLLLPKFLEKCGSSYEDEHISIIEIGGINFEHFIRIFTDNPVKSKVLCITDIDFVWGENSSKNCNNCKKSKKKCPEHEYEKYKTIDEYNKYRPAHVEKLYNNFKCYENIKIVTQRSYGSTFEDELFMFNIKNEDVLKRLLKMVLPSNLKKFLEKQGINFNNWYENMKDIPTNTRKKILNIIEPIKKTIKITQKDKKNVDVYENLFFAKLFYEYLKDTKGDFALSLLVDEELMNNVKVPSYIREGIEWILK